MTKLSEILSEYTIKIELEAEEKLEAIEELIDFLITGHEIGLRDRDYIIEAVFQRESSISTGVGNGVAIPHGTVDCIDEIVGAMGISSKGINFDSFDGEPVYIILLLIIPKVKLGQYIKTLANIARIFIEENTRDKIRSAKSPEKIIRIIEKAEREHEQ